MPAPAGHSSAYSLFFKLKYTQSVSDFVHIFNLAVFETVVSCETLHLGREYVKRQLRIVDSRLWLLEPCGSMRNLNCFCR